MARQDYQPFPGVEPTGPAGNYEQTNASPEKFGGEVGAAETRLGGQLEQSGQQIFQTAMRFKDMQNATDALDATTAASKDLGSAEVGFRQKRGNDAVAAYPAFQQQVQQIREQYASSLGSPMAKLAFGRDFASLSNRTLANAGIHVADQAEAAHAGSLNAAIQEESSRMVRDAANGSPPDFSKMVDLAAQTGSFMGWDKTQTDAFLQKHAGDAMHGIVESSIAAQDPNSFNRTATAQDIFDKAMKQNVPGTDVPLLDGAHVAAISDKITNTKYVDGIRQQNAELKAQRLEDHLAAQTRVSLDRTFSAASAIVDNGQSASTALANVTDAQIDTAFPHDPEQAASVKERFDDLRAVSQFQDKIAGATPGQIDTMLANVPKPDPNDPATYRSRLMMNRALATALTKASKALNDDPTTYVLGSHPDVLALGQAADKDSGQFAPYATAVLGIQTQMGVPAESQSVLPVPMASRLAQSITSDPEHAPAALKQMEQRYGAYWPNVWRDMVQRGGLPAAYQSVGIIPDEAQASLLARGLAEQGKSGKQLVDLLPPKARVGIGGIDTSIESSPDVQNLRMSLSKSGASAPMQSDVLNSIKTLAYANMVYGGKDQAASVQSAIDAFTAHYSFDMPGGPRVPKENADTVYANARTMLGSLSKDGISVPPIYGRPGQPSADEYLGVLRSSPTWITSPDAHGLNLMDPEGRLVRGKNGTPLTLPFSAPLMSPNESPGLVPVPVPGL